MASYAIIGDSLAAAFVTGAWQVDTLVAHGSHLLGRRWRWIRPLTERLLDAFPHARPRQFQVAKFIRRDHGFRRAYFKYNIRLRHPIGPAHTMAPIARATAWAVPEICDAAALARWLDISLSELDWFADRKALQTKSCRAQLQNYHYRILSKRFGQVRLIEAPKPRLKIIQRKILTSILDQIPVHDAAHGFRRHRNVQSFAACHANRPVVLRMDLHDFFPSVHAAQVQALFRAVGYPEHVSDLLAALCSNCSPLWIWDELTEVSTRQLQTLENRYAQPHLPQGAPTSPAIANLCSYRLDCRLTGLARVAEATYTRYADDLAFSGEDRFARSAERFHIHASAIIMEEGFRVHFRKTRIMRQSVQQKLAGVVVNNGTNYPRRDYDRLKATLFNCVRYGPHSQNRTGHPDFLSHLNGRIAHVEQLNAVRGQRLRKIFDDIRW